MSGILNNSRDAAPVWTISSGIKQSWLKVCTTYTLSWMANHLQLGRFSAKAGKWRPLTYKWRFDPTKFFLQKISGERR